jgi:hypothetical protein
VQAVFLLVLLIIDASDFPVIAAVMVETGDAARIEVESAIAVQVSACDSTDDAQDRKVVADHDYGFFRGMTLHDAIQSVPGPTRDIREFFAARNLDLCRLGSPFLNKLAVVLPNFREGQTFQFAMIKFANIVLDQHREAVMQTEELSGLLRALQIARVDSVNRFVGQGYRDLLCLTDSDGIQLQVGCSLAATLQIPIGGTVTDQENLHRVILRARASRKTLTFFQ